MDNQQERHVYISFDKVSSKYYIGSRKGKPQDKENKYYFGSFSDNSFNPTEKFIYSCHTNELIATFVENNLLSVWGFLDNFVNKHDYQPIVGYVENAKKQHLNDPEYSIKFQQTGTKANLDRYNSLSEEEKLIENTKRKNSCIEWWTDKQKEKRSEDRTQWIKDNPEKMKQMGEKLCGGNNPSAIKIKTPFGIFDCKKDLYNSLEITKYTLNKLLKDFPEQYIILSNKDLSNLLSKKWSGGNNPSAKIVKTPLGIFNTKKEACISLNITIRQLNKLIKDYPDLYAILNDY